MTDLPPRPPSPARGTGPAPPSAGEPLRLRLRGPADLVAAVPHLLGFVPEESLVLVGLVAGPEGRHRVGAVTRVDLPRADEAHELVRACARRMGSRAPDEVAAVVVAAGSSADPPQAGLVAVVEDVFAELGVPVTSRLWSPRLHGGQPWRCYPPCGCRGTLADPATSAAAAASAVVGQVTFASRGELDALVAPEPGADGVPRRRLLDEAFDAALLDRELAGPVARERDLRALRAGAAELARGGALSDRELARLAVALTDPGVRDVCLAWAAGHDLPDAPGVDPAAAEQLWLRLVRATPAPEVAESATLLACAVLVRGGGALVGVVLERARAADPAHRLSGLVAALLDAGIAHHELVEWMSASLATLAGPGPAPRAAAPPRRD